MVFVVSKCSEKKIQDEIRYLLSASKVQLDTLPNLIKKVSTYLPGSICSLATNIRPFFLLALTSIFLDICGYFLFNVPCIKLGGNSGRHFSSWLFDEGRPKIEQSGICELREDKVARAFCTTAWPIKYSTLARFPLHCLNFSYSQTLVEKWERMPE